LPHEIGLEELKHLIAAGDGSGARRGLDVGANPHSRRDAHVGLDEHALQLVQRLGVQRPAGQQGPQRVDQLGPRPLKPASELPQCLLEKRHRPVFFLSSNDERG